MKNLMILQKAVGLSMPLADHQAKTPEVPTLPTQMATALMEISGGPSEPTGYLQGVPDQGRSFLHFQRRTYHELATKLVEKYPHLHTYVRKHPMVQKKGMVGPIGKAPYAQQTTLWLAALLVDIDTYKHLRKRRLLAWDDGTYDTAMLSTYLWRSVVPSAPKMTQSAAETYRISLDMMHQSQSWISIPSLEWISYRHRARTSWIQPKERATLAERYHKLAEDANFLSEDVQERNFIIQSSLVDLGLRTRDVPLLESSLEGLQALKIPNWKQSAPIKLAQGQLLLLQGDQKKALSLLKSITQSDDPAFLLTASQWIQNLKK